MTKDLVRKMKDLPPQPEFALCIRDKLHQGVIQGTIQGIGICSLWRRNWNKCWIITVFNYVNGCSLFSWGFSCLAVYRHRVGQIDLLSFCSIMLFFWITVWEAGTSPSNPDHPRKKGIEIKLNIQFSTIHSVEYLSPFLWPSLCLS